MDITTTAPPSIEVHVDEGEFDDVVINEVDTKPKRILDIGSSYVSTMSANGKHEMSDVPSGCIFCKKTKRVRTSADVNKGSHLVFTRGCRQCPLYTHHAVVTEAVPHETDRHRAHLRMIEFHPNDNPGLCKTCRQKAYIRESELNEYDFSKCYILVREYEKLNYSPEEIVSRARRMELEYNSSEEKRYSLYSNNCEHYATHCCLGNPVSLQVKSCCGICKTSAVFFLGCMVKVIRLLIFLVVLSNGVIFLWTESAFQIISSFNVVVYLLVMMYRLCKNYKKQIDHIICCECGPRYRKRLKAEVPIFIVIWFVDMLLGAILQFSKYHEIIVSVSWSFGGFIFYIIFKICYSRYLRKQY
ncbi:hypothetical protein ScPMuIL_003271 [Solemya velum]